MVLKILALGVFQFIYWDWGGEVSTSLHAMNSYRNLSLTKVVLLPWNFLSLRNLASDYMSWTSQEIISLQKLYCFFKVLFLLRILLRTLGMVFLRSPLQCKVFLILFSWFTNVLSGTGILYICLILHILSFKYFTEGFGAFFTFLHPLIV